MFTDVGAWLQQTASMAAQSITQTGNKLATQSYINDFLTGLSTEVAELRVEIAQVMADDMSDTGSYRDASTNATGIDAGAAVSQSTAGCTDSQALNTAADTLVVRMCDVCVPPLCWTASDEAWLTLLRVALCDRDTCTLSPAALVTDAERWRRVCAVLSRVDDPTADNDDDAGDEGKDNGHADSKKKNDDDDDDDGGSNRDSGSRSRQEEREATAEVLLRRQRELYSAATQPQRYVPHADVLAWVAREPALQAVFTHVVSGGANADAYWHAVGWKCACYRLCARPVQLLEVMSLLATPLVAHDDDASDGGGGNNSGSGGNSTPATTTPYWRCATDKWRIEARQHRAWLCEQAQHVRKAIDDAERSADTLQATLAKVTRAAKPATGAATTREDGGAAVASTTAPSQQQQLLLLQSARESCEFHTHKLSRLVSQLCEQQPRLQKTCLDQYTGTLFTRLMRTCTRVAGAVHEACCADIAASALSTPPVAHCATSTTAGHADGGSSNSNHVDDDNGACTTAAESAAAAAAAASTPTTASSIAATTATRARVDEANKDSSGADRCSNDAKLLDADEDKHDDDDDDDNALFVATMPWEKEEGDDAASAGV